MGQTDENGGHGAAGQSNKGQEEEEEEEEEEEDGGDSDDWEASVTSPLSHLMVATGDCVPFSR